MKNITRRQLILSGGPLFVVSMSGCLSGSPTSKEEAAFNEATVHLDPSCGCCKVHADYLSGANANVQIIEHSTDELSKIKEGYAISKEYQSCHTTVLDEGLVVEGHVPIEVINSALEQELSGRVIALPGMPSGSPGMPGSKDEEWVFYTINDRGESAVFMRK